MRQLTACSHSLVGGTAAPPDSKLLPDPLAQPSLPTGPETLFRVASPPSLPSVTGLAQAFCPESETAYPGYWHRFLQGSGDPSPGTSLHFCSLTDQSPYPTPPIPPGGETRPGILI